MNIARCLATIDRLCSLDFPAEQGRTDDGESGPGFHVAELETSERFRGLVEDGSRAGEMAEQYEADRDGLAERLTERWGAPHVFSLFSTLTRSMEGEEIPEVWASLSRHVPDVQLWRHPDNSRWIALGVSRWDRELPFQLLAVVTDVAPP